MIFITSPFSLLSLLHLLSLSSPLIFSSPLRGLPLSLLWSFPLCLVLFSSFSLCVVLSLLLLLLLLLAASAIAACVAAVAAVLLLAEAGRRRCSCCCCGCCWWVLHDLERLLFVSWQIFRHFCLFSPSLRPLLISCQGHSARRVACT